MCYLFYIGFLIITGWRLGWRFVWGSKSEFRCEEETRDAVSGSTRWKLEARTKSKGKPHFTVQESHREWCRDLFYVICSMSWKCYKKYSPKKILLLDINTGSLNSNLIFPFFWAVLHSSSLLRGCFIIISFAFLACCLIWRYCVKLDCSADLLSA